MSDAFQETEDLGRYNFEQLLKVCPKIKKYRFTTGKFDHYDCELEDIIGRKYYVEIKHRAKLSSTNPIIVNKGVMLEVKKLDELLKFKDGRHLYVYILNDAKCYIYDLDKIDFTKQEITQLWCPKAGCKHSKGYEYKDVYELPTSLASEYTIPNYKESEYWKNLQKQTYVNNKG